MPDTIGVNLRVTGHCNQGGRKYMEDIFAVAYKKCSDDSGLQFAYFGIFDGHGGREAAAFAKKHLMDAIVDQKNFWSKNDDDVLKAIKEGFIHTHHAMWKEVGKWPKTSSGLPSTAGTTASIAFIKSGKLYTGHVGDSGIVLGYKEQGSQNFGSQRLTKDHKPESPAERQRIENLGGCVMSKSGVQRVVWNRPRVGHKGPVRRSTPIDQIPFLAVARSLGDLWSYSYEQNEFIVSPEPDVSVMTIDVNRDKFIILGSDGLWNMVRAEQAVSTIKRTENENDEAVFNQYWDFDRLNEDSMKHTWINPSKVLVEQGISRWCSLNLRADNTSVVVVMIDPPGPSRVEVLRQQYLRGKLRPRQKVECDDHTMTMVCGYPPDQPNWAVSRSPKCKSLNTKHGVDIEAPPKNNSSSSHDEKFKIPQPQPEDNPKPSHPNVELNEANLSISKPDATPQIDPVSNESALIQHLKCRVVKRKSTPQDSVDLKYKKSSKFHLDIRTCQRDMASCSKPCTRSRVQCS